MNCSNFMLMQMPSIKKLGLGYRFNQEREIVSLVYLSYSCIVLFSLIVVLLHIQIEELLPVSYRYHGMILLGIVNLLLIRFRLIALAKLLMLSVTPFVLLILPPLAGLTSDEFYFWFPYVPIALSLLPHFILHTHRERTVLIITLVLYFLLALFISHYMVLLQDGTESIIPIVLANRFYYMLIPVIIYVFVNLALGLVFAKNYKYEQVMLQQQNELIQSAKMASLGTLTTGIAHEINNPMNFISGGIHATATLKNELLKLEKRPSKEKKALYLQMDKIMENSLEGVQRVTDIVTSLQFFSNPGKMDKKDHELNQLLYSVLLSVERKIPYNITLIKDIPEGTTIHCYDEQMQQVFIHILLNAISAHEEKAVDKKKIIHIAATETKRGNTDVTGITFSNNGPLIPEGDLNKIFDPFFTLKDADKGKGLGMAISYMIISEHKGWIEARNENDLVVFEIMLPKS
ncbi:MAG: ATP-binding protein [Bacteroidota bacterium]|nr:ATP-binding protein [Bacteroidota bacterium]